MGLGKTPQAILYAKYFLKKGPIIVVCPASVTYNWRNEATRFAQMRAEVLEGMSPPHRLIANGEKAMFIIGYSVVHKWVKTLRRLRPKLIILDECHYIKSPGAKRTKAIRQLCRKIPHVIAISGTPITNRPAEFWTTLNIVRPDLFPKFYQFGHRYCKPEVTPWGVKYNGATRTEELHQKLVETCMIRRTKRMVFKELPPKQRIVIPIKLPAKAWKEYKEAENDFIRWLKKTYPKRANKARRAERMVKMGYLKRLVGTLKVNIVKEWIKDYLEGTDGKIITFAIHRAVLGPLHEEFEKVSVKIDGRVTGWKRQKSIDKFTKSKRTRLLLGQLQAMGVGWNGQVADTVLFAEIGWTPGEHSQAEDRAHRIGQKKVVQAIYLVAMGTIEEKLCKLLQKKQEVLDAVLDGKVREEGINIMDMLERSLLKKGKRK